MIGSILTFLFFRPLGLIILGIAVMGVGVFVTSLGHADLPERATLTRISGVLESATKVTRKRRGSTTVNYELPIRSAGGEVTKLTLPEREISEETVRSLLGRPIVALYSGEKDVWELTSGSTTIIDYQTTRQRRVETQAFEAAVGPYVGGGGLVVSLLGAFWLFRQRRVAATAETA
jgi:hypothetical protein